MEDRCVCCGEIVPEGQWVCEKCKMEGKRDQNKKQMVTLHSTYKGKHKKYKK